MRVSAILSSLALLVLGGCSKSQIDYYQPAYGASQTFTNSCSGKGPEDHIRIKLDDKVYVEVTAFYTLSEQGNFTVQIAYYVPQESTLKFANKVVRYSSEDGQTQSFPFDQVFRFMGTQHVERQTADGLLPGRTIPIKVFQEIRDVDVGYRVDIKHQFDQNADQFTIQLPDVEVTGQLVQVDPIQFQLTQLSRVLPNNCQLPQYQ
ncbi:hypothetical protein [Thalassotalea sp. PS06]|uniref:hypothetical protein n=1 Tax=Thalassotalea sp. PS06 TaxID=2594005 RepID=UPI001164DAA6|nr:hypothetical protein [Thalassotalea sp. PS06]QDP01293.1 hypothetical protein FNC98_08060 [Thalassotalea sp. PS06]